MDGSDNYNFRNSISNDGKTIIEIIDDVNKSNSGIKYIYRLAFRRDPESDGSAYKCKFVGYFKRSDITEDKLIRTYTRIDDSLTF